jgi:hypothetical protein
MLENTERATKMDNSVKLGTLASATTKTGRHDIDEIVLKVALKTINQIKSKFTRTKSLNVLHCNIESGFRHI